MKKGKKRDSPQRTQSSQRKTKILGEKAKDKKINHGKTRRITEVKNEKKKALPHAKPQSSQRKKARRLGETGHVNL